MSAHTPIPGWPGYAADRAGNIYSIASNWRGYGKRRMTPCTDMHGYLKVRLTVEGGRRRKVAVHKLIALTFVGVRPTPLHEVRHLDGNKSNNADANLAWGTRKENADDRELHGRTSRGEHHGNCIRLGLARRAA